MTNDYCQISNDNFLGSKKAPDPLFPDQHFEPVGVVIAGIRQVRFRFDSLPLGQIEFGKEGLSLDVGQDSRQVELVG